MADELPLWIAVDGGYFKKQGLDVTLTEITGKNGVPALLSGQVQYASIGGTEVLSAAANGADVKYLATLTPIYAYEMYSQPDLRTPDSLKGKRIGITSTSGSLYLGTVLALKQMGLSVSDVRITALGSVANVNNALLSGNISAAASHPPATAKFDKKHLNVLVDLATKKIPAAQVGIAALSSYAKSNPEVTQKFMRALIQATQREKSDKAYAVKELRKHLKVTDQDALDLTYNYYAKEVVPNVPVPEVSQFEPSKKSLSKGNPKVGDVDLSTLIDPSYVKKAAADLGVSK